MYYLPGLAAKSVSNNKDDWNDEEDMMFLSVFLMILVFIYSCPLQLSLDTSLLLHCSVAFLVITSGLTGSYSSI